MSKLHHKKIIIRGMLLQQTDRKIAQQEPSHLSRRAWLGVEQESCTNLPSRPSHATPCHAPVPMSAYAHARNSSMSTISVETKFTTRFLLRLHPPQLKPQHSTVDFKSGGHGSIDSQAAPPPIHFHRTGRKHKLLQSTTKQLLPK